MSSNRTVSKPSHRMAEVSAATIIVGGLVGPKARPKGVADGQTVDIPLPLVDELLKKRSAQRAGLVAIRAALEMLRLNVRPIASWMRR